MVDVLAAELRSRGMHDEADDIRLFDTEKWHTREPWRATEEYKEIEMETSDLQIVENALENAGSVYGVSGGKFESRDIKKLFPEKLELR